MQVMGKQVEESNKDEMTQFGLYNFMRLSVGVEWWVIITDKTSKIHTKAPQQPTECYIKGKNYSGMYVEMNED